MQEQIQKLKKLFLLKVRFALTSAVASVFDYLLFLLLVYTILGPVYANVLSFSCAVVLNFLLQKRFIFSLQRRLEAAFLLAVAISAGGLVLSTGIIYLLKDLPPFDTRPYLSKLVAMGVTFFYNFYGKRFAFEKRFFSVD